MMTPDGFWSEWIVEIVFGVVAVLWLVRGYFAERIKRAVADREAVEQVVQNNKELLVRVTSLENQLTERDVLIERLQQRIMALEDQLNAMRLQNELLHNQYKQMKGGEDA